MELNLKGLRMFYSGNDGTKTLDPTPHLKRGAVVQHLHRCRVVDEVVEGHS